MFEIADINSDPVIARVEQPLLKSDLSKKTVNSPCYLCKVKIVDNKQPTLLEYVGTNRQYQPPFKTNDGVIIDTTTLNILRAVLFQRLTRTSLESTSKLVL